MAIGTFNEQDYFALESAEVEARLMNAQRILERQRQEEARIQKQSRELAALNNEISRAWAYLRHYGDEVLDLLRVGQGSALQERAPNLCRRLILRLDVFLDHPHHEWAQLAFGEPKVLEIGNWVKLVVLLALGAAIHGDDKETRLCLDNLNARLDEWGVLEQSGILATLNQRLNMPNAPSGAQIMNNPMTPATRHAAPARMDDYPQDEAGQSGEKSVLLVKKIGDGESEKDLYVVKKYKPLIEPMQLVRVGQSVAVIQEVLDTEFPWMTPITAIICDELIENQRYQFSTALVKPFVLVGSPGSGKSHYVQRLADLMSVPRLMLSVGGMSDNSTLRGTARSWSTGRPSVISEFMNEHACPNPVVILDEIEKGGTGHNNGNVYDTLLQLLETRNAASFYDECLMSPIDLSRVTYCATANSTENLPQPIRDRLRVLRVPNPTAAHLLGLAYQMWWSFWVSRQIPMSDIPPLNDKFLLSKLKGGTSVRQVQQIMDVTIRHAKNNHPLMRLH